MKFHFALLGVLCAHALARDESNNKLLDATATSTGATGNKRLEDQMTKRDSIFGPSPKNGFARAASAEVVNTAPPSQSPSILSSCSGTTDKITVGLQGILAKNGVEYVYLPMGTDVQAACFEGYNSSVLQASDLFSCCDAAAKGKFNSFRFDGGVCTGFTAWLSPIYTDSYADDIKGSGLYIAKEKLSNFTSTAPTFKTSFSLGMARVAVEVSDVVDGCPHSKTLKITTYSKTKTSRLDHAMTGGYNTEIYLPELCNDTASADKRTVTVSILDWDGSVLTSATEVLSSTGHTGRHLLSNGVCVLYRSSPLDDFARADGQCYGGYFSKGVFADGFLSFAYLRQELARLKVNVMDVWTDATLSESTWRWYYTTVKVNMSLFNIPSLTKTFSSPAALLNVTDWLMYVVEDSELHATLCIDAPYFSF